MVKPDEGRLVDLESLRQIFEEGIPFHENLGFTVTRLERGSALVYIPYREPLMGNRVRPALHGGVLAAVADGAGGLVLMSNLPSSATIATIDLRIDFLRPALCADLWCSARIVRVGAQVGFAAMRLYQSDDRIVAETRAAYNITRRPTSESERG